MKTSSRAGMVCLLVLAAFMLVGSTDTWADAGFSIRRKTAPSHLQFEGTSSLYPYKLSRVWYHFKAEDSAMQNPLIRDREPINENHEFVIQDGGKRWDESERYLHFVLEDASGRVTDSFTVFMKKHNYQMIISGVKDGKLQYKMKRSKAVYNYSLATESDSVGAHRISRLLFIACSVAGFVLLILLFIKRKKQQVHS